MQAISKSIEWDGDSYHRLSDMQYTVAMQLVNSLNFTGNEVIMDAGCGSGRITREILERLPKGKLIGVDLGESMLNTARREVTAKPGQQVDFVQANLQTFVAREPVDGIFSNMALHFVHDHAVLFDNMAHSLKPGGWLALQFGSSQQLNGSTRQWFDMMNHGKFGKYLQGVAYDFKGADVAETEENLRKAGFEKIRVEAIEMQMAPGHREKMLEYFNDTVLKQCLARLPAELHDEFAREMAETFTTAFDQQFVYIRVRGRLPHAH